MATKSFLLHRHQIIFNALAGTLDIKSPEHLLADITASAVIGREQAIHECSLLKNGKASYDRRGPLLTLTIAVDHGWIQSHWWAQALEGDAFLTFGVHLFSPTSEVRIDTIRSLQLPWSGTHLANEIKDSRWWIFPSSAWDRPGTRPIIGAARDEDCSSIAYDIAGAYAPSGKALTLAHILPSGWINRIDASEQTLAINTTVGVKLAIGGSLASDQCLLDCERPITSALAAVGARHRGRHKAEDSIHHWGWNAWDYFTDKILEKDIDNAVAVISAKPWMKSKIRYIVVDDFWQTVTGDWQPGTRFGSIERTAQNIEKAGYRPGIWTAPFMVDRNSDLLRSHPDYALTLTDDRLFSHCMGCDPPWGDRCYLDPTHPGVVEHIFKLYRRLYQWGFRYFKTDFLTNSISVEFPGESSKYKGLIRYHNPDLGLVRAHRNCMEAIRAAIGPDSFWLGCGTHYASGAGLMDATRISGDMRVHYPNLLYCARSAIFNFHLHGGAFLIDPDFAIFRGRETALPGMLEVPAEGTKPYERLRGDSGPTFNYHEAQLWASVLIMSGGVLMLSDRIDGLNDQGLKIVRTLLEHGGGTSAMPVDIFSSLPQIWFKRHQDYRYLLVANWSDHDGVVTLPENCGLTIGSSLEDIWSGQRSAFVTGMHLQLPAHGHCLLRAIEREGG